MSVPFTSSFYNPGQYAPSEGSWYNTPYGTMVRQQNMPQAWYAYGRQQGIPDDNSGFARWFQQQYPTFNSGFAAATMENPYITIDEYTPTLGGYADWMRRFNQMAPQLRGENPSNYGNVTRWLGW